MAAPWQRVRTPADAWYLFKKAVYRVAVERRTDPELQQLRSLRRAYSKDRGPEILLFGDSAMFWTGPLDPPRNSLADLIRAELGRDLGIVTVAGPGYNPRLVGAFLTALEGCRSQPSIIVVPTSVLMATTLFYESPRHGYHHEARMLKEIVATGGAIPRKGLARASADEYEQYDRLPAPSLFGARRTVGEIRLIINSVPTTRWATAVRVRHMMDYYNAQRLEPDSPGVVAVRELGAHVLKLGIPAVAIIAPVNHQILKTTLGEDSIEHVRRNAQVVESAFLDGSGRFGRVVNALFESPSSGFVDPMHLTFEARARLARQISTTIRPLLFPEDSDD